MAAAAALATPGPALAHGGEGGGGWRLDPVPLAFAALVLVLVAHGAVRLRRRGRRDLASAGRLALLALAVAVALAAVVSPLDRVAERDLLSAHMLQHVLLGDLAPALALVALRGALLFFVLPQALLSALARRRTVRAAGGFLLRPATAFTVWAAGLSLWHLPAAYAYAVEHRLAHDLEHATFVVGGMLVWSQLVDPARRQELSTTGKLLFLIAVFAVGQGLATTLIAQPDPLYAPYAHGHPGSLGIDPPADQDLAGFVMMAEQMLTLGTCAFVLVRRHLGQHEEPPPGEPLLPAASDSRRPIAF